MRQKHKNSACFTSFALKCLNVAQILENFAQSCNFTTSAFRSSDKKTPVSSSLTCGWSYAAPELVKTQARSLQTCRRRSAGSGLVKLQEGVSSMKQEVVLMNMLLSIAPITFSLQLIVAITVSDSFQVSLKSIWNSQVFWNCCCCSSWILDNRTGLNNLVDYGEQK